MLHVSDLATFLFCARKLYLEKILGLREPPKAAPVLGTIQHGFYERINAVEKDLVTSMKRAEGKQGLLESYTATYAKLLRASLLQRKHELRKVGLELPSVFTRLLPLAEQEARIHAAHAWNIAAATEASGEALWQAFVPKIRTEVPVASAALELSGIVDQIEQWPEHIVPVELKTGKVPEEGIWESHRIQIAAYLLLLRENGNTVWEGKVRYVPAQVTKQVPWNAFLGGELQELLVLVRQILAGNLPDFVENKRKCLSCGLREQCYSLPSGVPIPKRKQQNI